jgi:hypothetical protein
MSSTKVNIGIFKKKSKAPQKYGRDTPARAKKLSPWKLWCFHYVSDDHLLNLSADETKYKPYNNDKDHSTKDPLSKNESSLKDYVSVVTIVPNSELYYHLQTIYTQTTIHSV